MRQVNQNDINSFLRLGYFLRYNNPRYKLDLSLGNKSKYFGAETNELVDIGIKKWKKAISRKYSSNQGNVVPLSGGLDSRAILASLLEHTEARNIRTYTFGIPGTFDYEIGNQIGRKIGTKHLYVPLSQYKYEVNKLIEISQRIDHQTCLFHHPDVDIIDKYCDGCHVWSGAIIDVFFGRHDHLEKANIWNEAKRNFIRENLYSKSLKLTNADDVNLFSDIEKDEKLTIKMSLEHCLDLLNRQLKFIAPHVLMKGYQYKVLFEDQELVSFSLSIDEHLLESQTLYKMMFLKAFPKYFKIRTKTSDGLPLNASMLRRKIYDRARKLQRSIRRKFRLSTLPNPYSNYLDFSQGIRKRRDLHNLIYSSLKDLKKRGVVHWIDIENIWEKHMTRKENYSKELITLASLEIHFKAGLKVV